VSCLVLRNGFLMVTGVGGRKGAWAPYLGGELRGRPTHLASHLTFRGVGIKGKGHTSLPPRWGDNTTEAAS
jgi:hypothetical protein